MNRSKSLETILVLAGALIVFYLIYEIKVLLIISIVLIAIGIFSKFLTEKISWLWLKFSEILGYMIPKIMLSIVFFMILTPIALLYKKFNKDSMKLKKTTQSSNFINRDHEYNNSDFENVW